MRVCSASTRFDFPVRKTGPEFHPPGLTPHFDIGIDEIIEGRGDTRLAQYQVATRAEVDAVHGMRAVEKLAFLRVLGRLRGVDGNPATLREVELHPAAPAILPVAWNQPYKEKTRRGKYHTGASKGIWYV
jgi:hypothetical protein